MVDMPPPSMGRCVRDRPRTKRGNTPTMAHRPKFERTSRERMLRRSKIGGNLAVGNRVAARKRVSEVATRSTTLAPSLREAAYLPVDIRSRNTLSSVAAATDEMISAAKMPRQTMLKPYRVDYDSLCHTWQTHLSRAFFTAFFFLVLPPFMRAYINAPAMRTNTATLPNNKYINMPA